MRSLVLKNCKIIDKNSQYHGLRKSILIENGIIKAIDNQDFNAEKTIDCSSFSVSAGWFDMRVSLCEPGLEHKETIKSGLKAAEFGGFTGVACLPNTQPIVQSKDTLSYIKTVANGSITALYPIAAATTDLKGEELSEMLDLHHHGAIAFSDAHNSISHTGLLVKALQYLKQVEALLILHPEDKKLTQFGQMNEGETSTFLGLKGIPALAEELVIKRDIELLDYAGFGKIHFSRISTKKSVEIIKKAKKEGKNITCDVSVAHLVFDDSVLTDFDTNFKLNPPLRTKSDIKALWEGIKDGTIDAIVSDHNPQDTESKFLEFDQAEFGMIALETAFAALNTNKPLGVDIETVIEKISENPRKILGLEAVTISENSAANLTVFDETKEWTFAISDIKSKSKNTPFIGTKFKGKVIGIINNNQHSFVS